MLQALRAFLPVAVVPTTLLRGDGDQARSTEDVILVVAPAQAGMRPDCR